MLFGAFSSICHRYRIVQPGGEIKTWYTPWGDSRQAVEWNATGEYPCLPDCSTSTSQPIDGGYLRRDSSLVSSRIGVNDNPKTTPFFVHPAVDFNSRRGHLVRKVREKQTTADSPRRNGSTGRIALRKWKQGKHGDGTDREA